MLQQFRYRPYIFLTLLRYVVVARAWKPVVHYTSDEEWDQRAPWRHLAGDTQIYARFSRTGNYLHSDRLYKRTRIGDGASVSGYIKRELRSSLGYLLTHHYMSGIAKSFAPCWRRKSSAHSCSHVLDDRFELSTCPEGPGQLEGYDNFTVRAIPDFPRRGIDDNLRHPGTFPVRR